MKTSLRLSAIIGLCILTVSFRSDSSRIQPGSDTTIFRYLERPDVLEITMELDFKKYIRQKKTNEYQPATLSIKQADGSMEKWDIEVRPRGKMRREVCDIPPMKLRFSEEQLAERGLDKRSTLKMVNLCRNVKGYEQLLLREYLAYRIYNLLTDRSFRVQLVKVKYLDEEEKETNHSFAFFIEHRKDLADRLDVQVLNNQRVGSQALDSDESELFTVFQYMIGNTDWFYTNNHNVDMCGRSGEPKMTPLPYDFDYAGFVAAPYAVPDKRLKLRHVTARYYQGRCRSEEETQRTLNIFLDKKPKVMQLVKEFPHFDKRSRKKTVAYIASFYDVIEDPKRWKRAITEHCDLWPVP